MGYAVSKAALQRVVGVLAVEHPGPGIGFFNLSPGGVATERIRAEMAEFGFDASGWAPPELIGAVVAWLVTAPEAGALSGTEVRAQDVALERVSTPTGPTPGRDLGSDPAQLGEVPTHDLLRHHP